MSVKNLTDKQLMNRLNGAWKKSGRGPKAAKPVQAEADGANGHGEGPAPLPEVGPLPPFGDGPVGTPPPQPEGASGEGRDDKGRFVRGWKGGPGNPFARKVAQLRSALVNSVTEDDMKVIAEDLVKKARVGFPHAIKMLFLYCIGRPTEPVNPDRLDLDEWQLLDAIPTRVELFRAICDSITPEQASAVLRSHLLAVEEATKGRFSIGEGEECEVVVERARRRKKT